MDEDITGPVGPVDYPVLSQIRALFIDEEPLVDSTAFDDPLNPTELVVRFTTGIETPGRMEITWWESGAYRFHYTEQGSVDFRFDRHPKEGVPEAHFHPPPDAGPPVPSCLAGVTQPQVLARAVRSQWRRAVVEDGGTARLNDGER